MLPLGGSDILRDKSDNMSPSDRICAEIGIIVYPDVQLAGVHGLTDLFRIAGEQARLHGRGEAVPVIRVSHWKADEAGDIACIFDTHPGRGHRPTHLIAPPSLTLPLRRTAMRQIAAWLRDWHGRGAILCSVCAGSFVLGETGLLDDRAVTTHWAFADAMAERFPKVRVDAARMVIEDGDIMTSGGILAWVDLGLTLVERLISPQVMLDTARFLIVDPPGRTQQAYGQFTPRLDHGDAAVLKVQHWLQATAAKDHTAATLAEIAGLEPRTFLRRFRKATGINPTEYAQQIRIAKAREALEFSRTPVEQIAFEVGYGDASAFRRLFQRVTGLAPADYRRRFGIAA